MSEHINEINKITVNSYLKVRDVNMTTLLFSDNLLCPRNTYTITDNTLILKNQPYTDLDLFQFIDTSNYYEFLVNLTTKGVTISGADRYGNKLDHLSDTVLVFINGYKISSAEYIINTTNNSITIKSTFNEKPLSNVIVYTSDAVYEGNVEDDFSWDSKYNQFLLKDYTIERYIFFKNGELLSPDKIQKIGDYVRLNTIIKHGVDIVEYYRMSRDCYALTFTPDIGYLTYGPKDDRGTLIQNPYNCVVTFDNIARLIVDDVRPGFFIHEVYGDGCVMMVDDDFEACSVKCLIIRKFKNLQLDPTEYFLTVPDAPTIVKYVSDYDLNGTLFKELLASFQKVLLNETYDSIKRIANIRNINKVDSSNISAMINFLGLNINLTNLTLDKKHNLIEELRTFYDVVGTRTSYNFYNAFKNDGKILKIEQLFTPIESTKYEKEDPTFFEKKWGELVEVKQTVSNNESHNSYVYIWSLRFKKGYVLPVVVRPDATSPSWNFSYIEETDITSYNSAVWQKDKNTWVNAVASDYRNMMLWTRNSVELANKDPHVAYSQNWDEKHLVNGKSSVTTSRFEFTLKNGVLTARDTYRNIMLGSWNSYIEKKKPSQDGKTSDSVYRYVTFRTAEELNAVLKQKFVTDVTDFGKVNELAKDGTNLSNTPRFEGVLRYSDLPILTQGVLDRYHPSESGPYSSEDKINLYLLIHSLTRTTMISNDKNYECEINQNNNVVLNKYVGNNSNVKVPASLSCETKTIAEISVNPTNLNVNLYDTDGNHIKLYEYKEESNTYCYIIEDGITYHYEIIDKKKNILYSNDLERGDHDLFKILPLINDYLTNPKIGPNQPTIDCGYITDEHPVDFYDFGSVKDQLDGHWVSWYEWNRLKNWYPTNHVDLSLEIPFDVDYDTFMNEFKNTFYEIASAVVYIHQVTQIYMFGNPDNMGDYDIQPMSLLTTCPYETEEYCVTNDHNFLPYKKAIGNKPLKMKSYMFKNPTYQYTDNENLTVTVDLYTNYGRDEDLYKETGEEKDIEWTETLTGVFPCRQLNYTDWTKEEDTNDQTTGEASWTQISNIPKFTVSCIPYFQEGYSGFFPISWGTLIDVKQTVANNELHNSYVYIWSLRFENGYVLPVVVRSNYNTPSWDFSFVEETDITSYNSAVYNSSTNRWFNTTATDHFTQMTWDRINHEYANKDYTEALRENWDEGHTIDNHASTRTSRYRFTLNNGVLTAVDTYTNTNMGTWSSYVSGSHRQESGLDWMYSLVINYDNREEGYAISQDLQTVTKVIQTNQIKKLQTVVNNELKFVRPNCVFYEKDNWYLSYVNYDEEFKVYEWKLPTLNNTSPENEHERLDVGIGEFYRKHADEIDWNKNRPGEVIVDSKAEIRNNKMYITVDTNEDPLMYQEINKYFDINNREFNQKYSYTHNNITWSCDLSKFNVYNNVQLYSDNETNSTTLLLPTNMSYYDKNKNLKYNFANIDYGFSKTNSELELIKHVKTEEEEKQYYRYTNYLASNVNQSTFTFNTYGTLLTKEQIILKDVDYIVIRYKWTTGSDLDSHTRITNSSNTNISNYAVGWYASSGSYIPIDNSNEQTNLMNWAGDNQGTGQESILINVSNMKERYASDLPNVVHIELRCGWWRNIGGDVYIQVDGYKNGTMRKDGYAYVNIGGELKYSIEEKLLNVNYSTRWTTSIGGIPPENCPVHVVATLSYNQTTKNAILNITPKQDS